MRRTLFVICYLLLGAFTALGNENITNPPDRPVNVTVSAGATRYTVTRSAASTTASTWVAARTKRAAVTLYNLDAAITVYFKELGGATVTSANGFPLGPGQSKVVNTTAGIQVIAASGTPALVADEEYR